MKIKAGDTVVRHGPNAKPIKVAKVLHAGWLLLKDESGECMVKKSEVMKIE